MPRSRRFGRSRFTLILLILASLTILTLDYRDTGPVQGLRSVAGTVFSPFRAVGDAVATPFRNGWNGIFGYDDLEDENDRPPGPDRGAAREPRSGTRPPPPRTRSCAASSRCPVTYDIERVMAEVVSAPLTSFDTTARDQQGRG